ncbi:ubiquitin carboxyl-terminal hydrolase-domain-containing protein [Camillea tinctor]|nr:ubiquitin carboxyl-terminal hydrolase-domain-containing protein [Camillea tinctor]
MKAAGLPKKFLSRRDKNGHRRGRSSEPGHKHRPLSSEAFFSMFKSDSSKQASDEETAQEKEAAKIDEVRRKVANLDLASLNDDHIRYVLRLKHTGGDVDKAIEILLLQQTSLSGKIVHYDPSVHMLGAENRGNVTCYLDALLFAMFAKLESFECMLKGDIREEPKRRLAALLRLWVNMLRSGKLIETDMTEHIQEALAACGWRDAQLLEQQDTSEAFAFITETLQLPLLTLQVDLFHQGKNDDADHKVVYERLLNLAVPPDVDGKGVDLEDCLEEYFNSQVDVLRDSLDDKKMGDRADLVPTPTPLTPRTPNTPRATIRVVTEGDDRECTAPQEEEHHESAPSPLERRWTTLPDPRASQSPPLTPNAQSSGSHPTVRPHRSRTESIIQRVVLDEDEEKPSEDADTATLFKKAKKTASVVKAITIPAWQFFRLIPWHLPVNKEPESDVEVARHFNQRPVLGICLKRYMMDEKGNMKRQNTYIDIPDSLRLPHFIVDDRHVEENDLSMDYKLVLQSVVCHRGESLHSGHYVSFCRVAPKLLTDNRRHDSDPPPDYEEAQWVKFDDLAIGDRVAPVDDIKQSLKEEMPYLLFYQIVPVVDVAASSTESTDAEPPAYEDAALKITTSDASGQSQDRLAVSRKASSYFDSVSGVPSASGSVRFSAEFERPFRRSFADEDGYLSVSRRGSAAFDSIGATPDGPSPAVTPSEESTAQRLTRAAAKFKGSSKSRPSSQAGESRVSITMSRLGLVKSSKEPLRDSAPEDLEAEDAELAASNGVVNGAASGKDGQEKQAKGGKDHPGAKDGKRGKSKTRPDKDKDKEKDKDKDKDKEKEKGKGKEGKASKRGDLPERECIVQ